MEGIILLMNECENENENIKIKLYEGVEEGHLQLNKTYTSCCKYALSLSLSHAATIYG